ncbi:hypothetical protein H1P_4560003 [Hyella patelloides LEGE 07179]|uniref:Uncharacterized protein n=1 Tax=Hyella patelloides LEGE 07179 TaxID=945734 RepID=A0A563VZ02_9CYAN|nr:hypothetical protein [Hyella patelloides]VEP16493.1 hypothetical protein H1P_4560003 [Hyella patelloides LEGE 07179]
MQQTELAFLAPPSQRAQCRYFNAERLVNWAINLLNCPWKICSALLPSVDLSQWIDDLFGQSMFSKRKTFLELANNDMKTV